LAHKLSPAKFRIFFGAEIAMGPGKADMLEAIRTSGSISEAARQLSMSYKRGWNLVDTMNRCFREPVVDTATGGGGGGGARVTPFGEKVLAHFRAMERNTDAAIRKDLVKFSSMLAAAPRR
jgi:molybdate transport system regulatory protein